MRIAELAVAGGFLAMGIRSFVYWIRRPFESVDPRDHLLFASFVVGRVGTWLSLGAILWLSATLKDPNGSGAYLQGRAFTDYFYDRYWWCPIIVAVFAAMQVLAGWFLGHRGEGGD